MTPDDPVPPVLWAPPADARERSRMGRYLAWLARERGVVLDDYDAAWRWSVDEPGAFWQSVWDHFEVRSSDEAGGPGPALADARMPGARWFPGASLSYAEHALAMPGRAGSDEVLVGVSQSRERVTLTADELRDAVARCRAGLAALGVGRGDRVAAYLPNIPETIVAFLATASLGAVWSSCAPEFGVRAVVDRLAQVEPRVLLTVDGYRYGDRDIDRAGEVAAVRDALPGLEAVVVVPYLRDEAGATAAVPGAIAWRALLGDPGTPRPPLAFERVPFDHPLYILFSSGTTGLPKAIVHGHRRHPPRALQGARPPHRPRPRRPLLLVHDDRLDDVELPRVRAGGRLDPRPVRRQPGVAGPRGRCGGSPPTSGVTYLGLARAVPHGLPGGRAHAGR